MTEQTDYYDYGIEGPPDAEQAIDDILGENPRSRELRLMRFALEQRRHAFAKDRLQAKTDKDRAGLAAKVSELEKQIAALKQEEAITTFVEDSVRVTIHKPTPEDLDY